MLQELPTTVVQCLTEVTEMPKMPHTKCQPDSVTFPDHISFLYRTSSKQLPTPIPSPAEIEGSKEVLCSRFGHQVVAVGPHFVVKYGPQVNLDEGYTMIFVEEQTDVSVPHVHALFRDTQTQRSYIVMERISGKTLEEHWSSFDVSQKEAVTDQIKTCVARLRAIPSPATYCSIDNKPLRDTMVVASDVLASESDFNAAIIKKCMTFPAMGEKVHYYERHMPAVLHGHHSTFTHGDLQRKNIMVRPDHTIVFLDWETAGWYPNYWEYCQAFSACHFRDDWHEWLDRLLEPFPVEWSWINMLTSEMWG